jgi:hypothetical protein
MDLQSKKLQFILEILSVSDKTIIDKLESVLKKELQNLDAVLKDKLSSMTIKTNKYIIEGKVFRREEAEKRSMNCLVYEGRYTKQSKAAIPTF